MVILGLVGLDEGSSDGMVAVWWMVMDLAMVPTVGSSDSTNHFKFN